MGYTKLDHLFYAHVSDYGAIHGYNSAGVDQIEEMMTSNEKP